MAVRLKSVNGRLGIALKELDGEREHKERIEVPLIKSSVLSVELVGTTSLKVHAMSAKTRTQISEAAQVDTKQEMDKRKKVKRAPKDPWSDFVHALHLLPGVQHPYAKYKSKIADGRLQTPFEIGHGFKELRDTFGFPCSGFGSGIRSVLRQLGFGKKDVAGIWVLGSFMPLRYKRLVFEEVACRVGPYKVADMHYRGCFEEWSAKVQVEFDTEVISAAQLVNAMNRAGKYCGLGEERPSAPMNPKTGGMYYVTQK